jgi:uncharacterized protein (DUF1015 family)
VPRANRGASCTSRPIDAGRQTYADAVYATAAENLRMVAGVLMRDASPPLRLSRHLDRPAAGEDCCVASLADCATNRIRHELTTPVETDRVRQIEALNAQTGPVMGYPHAPGRHLLKRVTERDPMWPSPPTTMSPTSCG